MILGYIIKPFYGIIRKRTNQKGATFMALDGITVHCIVDELSRLLTDGRIDKIHQPQKDEISMTIR